jgi:hypothetical protein
MKSCSKLVSPKIRIKGWVQTRIPAAEGGILDLGHEALHVFTGGV